MAVTRNPSKRGMLRHPASKAPERMRSSLSMTAPPRCTIAMKEQDRLFAVLIAYTRLSRTDGCGAANAELLSRRLFPASASNAPVQTKGMHKQYDSGGRVLHPCSGEAFMVGESRPTTELGPDQLPLRVARCLDPYHAMQFSNSIFGPVNRVFTPQQNYGQTRVPTYYVEDRSRELFALVVGWSH